MSNGSTTKAKRELVEAGLIRVEKKIGGHGKMPYDEIHIADINKRNDEFFSCTYDERDSSCGEPARPRSDTPCNEIRNKEIRNAQEFSEDDDDDSEDPLGPLEKPDYYIMDEKHPSDGPIIDVAKRAAYNKRNGIKPTELL